MPITPKHAVLVCLECGGELVKENSMRYVCKVCGEPYMPDEVGIPIDAPTNIYMRKKGNGKNRNRARR